MDLLGSIMKSMEAPPKKNEKEIKRIKEEKSRADKLHAERKKQLEVGKHRIEERLEKFVHDKEKERLQFEPMDKVFRTIVHDLSERYELATFSFGEEEVDRSVLVCKKDFVPSDDELDCLRRGQVYDPEEVERRKLLLQQKLQSQETNRCTANGVKSSYIDKYHRILGSDPEIVSTAAGIKASAQATQSNKAYGMVSSELKRNTRSIEQTLSDIRKKKQKLDESANSEHSS